MPDKKEPYMSVDETEHIVCAPDYRNLTLTRDCLHTNVKKELSLQHDMESNVTSCNTAFPVDLKEVFELTNPNAEIHQAILRNPSDLSQIAIHYAPPSQILHSSKEQQDSNSDGDPVSWRHVLHEETPDDSELNDQAQLIHSIKDPSEEGQSWENVINEAQSLNDDDRDENEVLHSTKSPQISVISDTEAWNHVIKQNSEEDKHLSKSQLLSGDDHEQWNHVLDQIPTRGISHSQLIHDHNDCSPMLGDQKQWNNVLAEQEAHQDVSSGPPMDLSSDCTKLTPMLPERRDVSIQVDDIPFPTSSEEDPPQGTSSVKISSSSSDKIVAASALEDVPQSMLNLTIATEAPSSSTQVVVHNGIKPELYTQERHLVVQAGTKAQATPKTSSTFPCTHCGKVFADSRSLQRHMLIHIGLRPYRCPVCGKAFMLNGDLTRHIRIHSGERPYACDICGRRFTLKGNLMQHFRTHTPEKQYACTICEKNYAQKDSLHRHIRAHFGEKPFECTTCGKRFTLKGDLSRHILIHSGVKPHSCKFCGRQFALKGNLTQHVRTHVRMQTKGSENSPSSFVKSQSESQVICDLSYSHIQKTFTSVPSSASPPTLPHIVTTAENTDVTSPISYIQTSSPSETNLPSPSAGLSFCSECSKTFPSPESLHEHVQLIHEQSTRLASNRYLCNICQKEFCLKGDLTRHLNSHNGIKPYECEHCNKTFTLKSNLRQHLTTHQVDKNFACPMCSKSFGNRRNLNLHLRRHEQARANFTCTKCGRSFLAKSDHFFHECVKDESSPTDCNAQQSASSVINSNTPPASPEDAICSTPVSMQATVDTLCEMPVTVASLPVKREACTLICDEKDGDDDIEAQALAVNGAQSFLGPFYRHLYFSTSHQTMLPTLKGLLHATSGDSNLADYSRVTKTS